MPVFGTANMKKRLLISGFRYFALVGLLSLSLGMNMVFGQVIALNDWSSQYNGTSNTISATSYTIPTGSNSNRLFVIGIATTSTTAISKTVTVSYGGQTLTAVNGDLTSARRQNTELYYLKDAGIKEATNTTISVTVNGSTTANNSVYAAVFDNVDQVTPITNSQNYSSGTTNSSSLSFSTALTVNANDLALKIVSLVRTGSTGNRTISSYGTNWTGGNEQIATYNTSGSTNDLGIRNGVAVRTIPLTNTTDVSTTTLNNSALASMTGLSLNYAGKYFRSLTSGIWSNTSIWQVSYDNSTWVAATTIPTSGDNQTTIQSGHKITLSSDATSGSLTIYGTLDLSTFTLTGSGTMTVPPNGTLLVGGPANFPSGFISTTLSSGSIVNYYYTGNQTLSVQSYSNLTLSGTGVKTAAITPTVNGVLSMEGTATIVVTSGVVTYGPNATLQYNTLSARTATSEEWISPFVAGGGIIIENTGAITIPGPVQIGNNTNVPLNITTGATLTPGANLITLQGDFINTGTFTSGSGGITINGTTTTQTIAGFTTTGTVTFSKTAGTATISANINGGGLTINGSGGTLNLGTGLTHTFSGTWARTTGILNGGSSLLKIGGNVSGTGGTFTAASGEVEYYFSGTQTTAAVTYNNLTFSGGGAKSLASGTSILGNLSISGATANITAGLNIPVGSLTLGGVNKIAGTYGSTAASSATYHDNTFFATTTGFVTVSTYLCSGSPTPGNTISTANPVCSEKPFMLSLQTPGSGFNYQWQSSSDGTTWSDPVPTQTTLINTDFSSQPANTNVYGSSTLVTGGELILTPVTLNYSGGFVVQTTPGSNITPFTISYDYRIFDGTGADGMSLSYASSIANTVGGGEVGEGNGLIVQFDTYNNSANTTASQIRIIYGGTQIWANIIGVFNLRNVSYRNMTLSVDVSGYLSLTIAGTSIVSDILLPGYAAADKTNWKFKFSGRTGSLNDKQSIDNLNIQMGVVSNNSTFTSKQTSSNYYRCNVTCSGSTATSTPLLVNLVSDPTFTVSPEVNTCSNSGVTYTTQAGQSAYVWTVSGVLNTDYKITSGGTGSSSNTVTLKWLTAGSKTVSVNYNSSSGCTDLTAASSSIFVSLIPGATISYPGTPYCKNLASQPVTRTGTTGGTYSSTTGLTIDAATGAITPNTSNPGTYTVTYTIVPAGGCDTFTTTTSLTIVSDLIWTGNISTDWNNAGNWSCAYIPDLTTNVTIPNVPRKPILSSGAIGAANNIVINTGSSLTIILNTLQIAGEISNSGTFISSSGTINMVGSAPQTIGANTFAGNTIMNLTISNADKVTLQGPLSVTGVVNLDIGDLDSGGNLILLSTASQTALVDGNGSGNILGNVTMQRYLSSAYGYKYISSPFSDATVATFTTYLSATSTIPTFYSYDESKVSTGWVSSTSGTLSPMMGYAANLGSVGNIITMNITGNVNNGDLSVNLYNNNRIYTQGFNLVGNPYPSPIDWDASGWENSNIDDAIYYFNSGNSSQYTGTYSSYVNGIASGNGTNQIAAMQGFFVHVTDPISPQTYPVTGTLGLTNSVRVNNLTASFREAKIDNRPILRFSASIKGANTIEDAAVIYFDDKAKLNFITTLDALKMTNTDALVPNIYTLSQDSRQLSIYGIPLPNESITRIPLGITTLSDGWVNFNAKDISQLPSSLYIYLADIEKGITQDLIQLPEYSFYLKAGIYNQRFQLVFSTKALNSSNPQVEKMFTIGRSGTMLMIKMNLPFNTKGKLFVTNMNGQVILRHDVFEQETVEISPNSNSAVYIITVISGSKQGSEKVLIRKDYE